MKIKLKSITNATAAALYIVGVALCINIITTNVTKLANNGRQITGIVMTTDATDHR